MTRRRRLGQTSVPSALDEYNVPLSARTNLRRRRLDPPTSFRDATHSFPIPNHIYLQQTLVSQRAKLCRSQPPISDLREALNALDRDVPTLQLKGGLFGCFEPTTMARMRVKSLLQEDRF